MLLNHPSRNTQHHSLKSIFLATIFPYSSGEEGSWEGILMERHEAKSYSLQWPQLRGTESPEMDLCSRSGERWMYSGSHTAAEWGGTRPLVMLRAVPASSLLLQNGISTALGQSQEWGNTDGMSLTFMDWPRKSCAC